MATRRIIQSKKTAFLEAYGRIGVIAAACRVAQISRVTHYSWLAADPEYAAAFALKTEEAKEVLEAEARRRAVEGVDKPVVYQGKIMTAQDGQPLTTKEYSDTLLIFLLKGAMPEKYKERYEHGGPGGGPIPVAGAFVVVKGTESEYITALRQGRQAIAALRPAETDGQEDGATYEGNGDGDFSQPSD